MRLGGLYRETIALSDLVDRYLAQHQADPATIRKLTSDLRQAVRAFGAVPLELLVPADLATWRASLSEGARHGVFRSLKQVLRQAVDWRMIERNPADGIKNPKPKAPEIRPFESWEEVEAIATELGPRFGPSSPSPSAPVYARRSGSPSSGATSTERHASSRSSASTRRASSSRAGSQAASEARASAPARPRRDRQPPSAPGHTPCSSRPRGAAMSS